MSKRRLVKAPSPKPQAARRPMGRWVTLAIIALIAVGAAAFWWMSEAQNTAGGRPRLVVDRTEMDLGSFPFEKWAKAVFTLTNAGDGPLQILEVPLVRVLQGC
jgi:hypothetical protein